MGSARVALASRVGLHGPNPFRVRLVARIVARIVADPVEGHPVAVPHGGVGELRHLDGGLERDAAVGVIEAFGEDAKRLHDDQAQ